MTDDLFIEMEYAQFVKDGQAACGDTVRLLQCDGERRVIAALCDGLGSGVKANVMANMTATMAVRFLESRAIDIRDGIEVIMDSLPMCSVRKISYSTFSLFEYELGQFARVIEMGNPACLHLRGTEEVKPVCERRIVSKHWPDREMRECYLDLKPGDRLIICSDGVTQAGLGETQELSFGWRRRGLKAYVAGQIARAPDISARELSLRIARKARDIVPGKSECLDDISALVIYMRKPRVMRVLSGPPFHPERDSEFAALARVLGEAHTLVSGGTTANIIERELGEKVKITLSDLRGSRGIPPSGVIPGIAKTTEGILTMTRVVEAIEEGRDAAREPGPVKLMMEMFASHDIIEFHVGTKVNELHQDPDMPQDLDIRRTTIRRLENALKSRWRKKVKVKLY